MQINLKTLYPYYTKDEFIDVPDDVALVYREFKLKDEAYRIRTYRHKAYYSLDLMLECVGDIRSEEATPQELLEQKELERTVQQGLSTLSEKQQRRIYEHFFLNRKMVDIAKAEGVYTSSVSGSIHSGLKQLEKYLQKHL